jgi:hypothetical protein
MFITKNCKNVQNDQGHGVLWEQATHSTLLPWNSITEGMFMLANFKTSATQPKTTKCFDVINQQVC